MFFGYPKSLKFPDIGLRTKSWQRVLRKCTIYMGKGHYLCLTIIPDFVCMNLHAIYVISLDVFSPEFCLRWLGYGWRTSSSCVEQLIHLGIITSKSTSSQYLQQLKTSLKALFQFCSSFLFGISVNLEGTGCLSSIRITQPCQDGKFPMKNMSHLQLSLNPSS